MEGDETLKRKKVRHHKGARQNGANGRQHKQVVGKSSRTRNLERGVMS